MYYDGDGSKAYWPNYAQGKHSAITVPVPTDKILLGASGNNAQALNALVDYVIKNDLGGIMIWQNSVKPGAIAWPSACGAWGCDSFGYPAAQQALKDAIKKFEPFNKPHQKPDQISGLKPDKKPACWWNCPKEEEEKPKPGPEPEQKPEKGKDPVLPKKVIFM